MRRWVIIFASGIFLLCAGTVGILLDLHLYAVRPMESAAAGRLFMVSPGQRFSVIADNLQQAGIVNNPNKFKLLARITGRDRRVKAGQYQLSPAMTPNEILDRIVIGKVALRRMTIPEGYSLPQIAGVVETAGFTTASKFMEKAEDADFARSMGLNAETFEGYLFPDTYRFPLDETPDKIVSTMAGRFWAVFKEEWRQQAHRLGLSIHQVVTLASIIEKETGEASERPIISSVFHNRLKKNMRLESDPTVIYDIQDFDGNLTRKHLNADSLYNTYRIRGLPPGPIASPGAKALEAALFPADTPYLYFVSKKDGTHAFSTNLRDHNRAVGKYQLGR
jgi:UPF0755 protein